MSSTSSGVIQSPRGIADDVAVELAGLAHGRGVDDGQKLAQVLDEHPVEERFIAILQGRQPDVLLQVVGLGPDALELEGNLLLDGEPRMGQEPAKAEPVAVFAENDALLVAAADRGAAAFPAVPVVLFRSCPPTGPRSMNPSGRHAWSSDKACDAGLSHHLIQRRERTLRRVLPRFPRRVVSFTPVRASNRHKSSRPRRPELSSRLFVSASSPSSSVNRSSSRSSAALFLMADAAREERGSWPPLRAACERFFQSPDPLLDLGDPQVQIFVAPANDRRGSGNGSVGGIIARIQSMGARNGASGAGCCICSRIASDCRR